MGSLVGGTCWNPSGPNPNYAASIVKNICQSGFPKSLLTDFGFMMFHVYKLWEGVPLTSFYHCGSCAQDGSRRLA